MHSFSALKSLELDEQIFCNHWTEPQSPPLCLVSMLPSTVTCLTIRMHDKFRVIDDIIELGAEVCQGNFQSLIWLTVTVKSPVEFMHRIEDPEHYLIDTEDDDRVKRKAIELLYAKVKRSIQTAFDKSKVKLQFELITPHWRRQYMYYTIH